MRRWHGCLQTDRQKGIHDVQDQKGADVLMDTDDEEAAQGELLTEPSSGGGRASSRGASTAASDGFSPPADDEDGESDAEEEEEDSEMEEESDDEEAAKPARTFRELERIMASKVENGKASYLMKFKGAPLSSPPPLRL